MKRGVSFCVTCFTAQALYPEFESFAQGIGYASEEHHITTSDNWKLTIPRITGKVGEAQPSKPKPTVIIWHGHGGYADGWLYRSILWDIVDLGYDVWVGNSRGNSYTKHATLDPIADAKEYWDFSWAEMGIYDVPAVIDYIKALTKVEKVWYIGYSQGTTQMFYGLAHLEDSYYQNVLEGFIAYTPCTVENEKRLATGAYKAKYDQYETAGVYAINGPNMEDDRKRFCAVDDFTCDLFEGSTDDEPWAIKQSKHYWQNTYSKRFQEYSDNYTQGSATTLIPLSTIDKVPIYLIVGALDNVCRLNDAKAEIFEKIPSIVKMDIWHLGNHSLPERKRVNGSVLQILGKASRVLVSNTCTLFVSSLLVFDYLI